MIKVEPMPDEPSLSHEARRRHVVGARHQHEHFAWMRSELGLAKAEEDGVTDLDILARASGMTSQSYAVKHTLLSSFLVAAPAEGCSLFGSVDMARRAGQFAMRLPRRHAFVCPKCIDGDMASERYSWFRRSHQLAGLDWCAEHGENLHQVAAEQPFEHPPNWWRDEALIVDSPTSGEKAKSNAFIDRHAAISLSLLRRDRPVPCEALNQRLFDQARRVDVGWAKTKGQTLLSDRLLVLAGDDWLYRHFPHFAMKTRGLVYRPIDNLLKRRETAAPGEVYVLALAALFDSAEAALTAVALADDEASNPGKAQEVA